MYLKNRKIVILHKTTQKTFNDTKLINLLRQHWVKAGADIEDLFGTDTFVPADLVIVHVDLSVVPTEYQKFAARYPSQINANIFDIRKSKVCKHLLSQEDVYNEPVIVKTDLNFAGIPDPLVSS
ncbi:MAG: hypothetical protein O3C43_13910 [Verrucomicrobia bacterium]|nr:hypothetical protein [Verrucomicrobiota bacterium]